MKTTMTIYFFSHKKSPNVSVTCDMETSEHVYETQLFNQMFLFCFITAITLPLQSKEHPAIENVAMNSCNRKHAKSTHGVT